MLIRVKYLYSMCIVIYYIDRTTMIDCFDIDELKIVLTLTLIYLDDTDTTLILVEIFPNTWNGEGPKDIRYRQRTNPQHAKARILGLVS